VTPLARATSFIRELEERVAQRIEPYRYGVALLHDELPLVYDLNFVRGDDPAVEPAALAAEAERIHARAGHTHRKLHVDDPDAGGRLAPPLEAMGYQVIRHLVMAHVGPPDRPARGDVAEEVPLDELRGLRETATRREPWGADAEVVRQLLARRDVTARATRVRSFAARVDGRPVAACELYSDGRTAQIEDVATLAEHRGRGLARAVVLAALDAARGHDFVFIVADADDWPQELYRKLGFEGVGLLHRFLRTQSPPAG
jgi:ribosomal protein S18 acetylase RimI-like enzyme